MIDIINIIKILEKFSSHLIAIIIASFVILNFLLQNSIIYLEI